MGIQKKAFAVCASGRYVPYLENLEKGLAKYAPGIEVVRVDPAEAAGILGAPEWSSFAAARFAVPLMGRFSGYGRVVWLDADTDVASGRFASIFSEDAGRDGVAAASYSSGGRARFDPGVLLLDLHAIDRESWRSRVSSCLGTAAKDPAGSILNAVFDPAELDPRYNRRWDARADPRSGSWLVHYSGRDGKEALSRVISDREARSTGGGGRGGRGRFVAVAPRSSLLRPFVRAYLASGNTAPLYVFEDPESDWGEADRAYCDEAVRFTGGKSASLGRFSRKAALLHMASEERPEEWAWIDACTEVCSSVDACFLYASSSRGGRVFGEFYRPSEIGIRVPDGLSGGRICRLSPAFFSGASDMLASAPEGPEWEGAEAMLGRLYSSVPGWGGAFRDTSIRRWQKTVSDPLKAPEHYLGRFLRYEGDAVRVFERKRLPDAPFERALRDLRPRGSAPRGAAMREAAPRGSAPREAASRGSGAAKKRTEKASARGDSVDVSPVERPAGGTTANGQASGGPVDAVFVIGTGSLNGNEELRYALRNLESHCPFVRRVYICGECPAFVDRSAVTHLQWPDRFRHAKDANIIDKLRHACEQPGVAERVLFCSDDQFQTRECSWGDFRPRYLRRYSSNDGWYAKRRRVWHNRLRDTLEREVQRRREAGEDANEVYYYQPHIWMPVDRDMFLAYARWCGYEKRSDTIIASGYFNFAGAESVALPDYDHVFLRRDASSPPVETHVAYTDSSFDAAMRVLRAMFPWRSRFELPSPPSHSAPSVRASVVRASVVRASVVRPGAGRFVQAVPRPSRPALPALPDVPEGKAKAKAKATGDAPPSRGELSRIMVICRAVREEPAWYCLMHEVSVAEEMRLFGASGWRKVWRDIEARWEADTDGGRKAAPVLSPRSDEATAAVAAYMSDPEGSRTVRFSNVKAPQQKRSEPSPPSFPPSAHPSGAQPSGAQPSGASGIRAPQDAAGIVSSARERLSRLFDATNLV